MGIQVALEEIGILRMIDERSVAIRHQRAIRRHQLSSCVSMATPRSTQCSLDFSVGSWAVST